MNDDFEMYEDSDSSSNNVNSNNNQFFQPSYQNTVSNSMSTPEENSINFNNNQINQPLYQNNIGNNNINNQQKDSDSYQNNLYDSTLNSTYKENHYNEYNSVLTPMYEEKNNLSYEEALKMAKPIIKEEQPQQIVEEQPKEVTYTNDFMDYDPMLHNDLQTDGDYVITSFDPNQKSDYVPEKTDFDSEGMMESFAEENVEKELPKQQDEEPSVPEDYNTVGMMTYDTNNVDTFNDGKTPTKTIVTRFIFDEMKGKDETPDKEQVEQPEQQIVEKPKDVGSIPIYNRQEEIDQNIKNQNSGRKTYEMVGMVIFFALLILLISFFPDINKIFDNIKK